MYQIAKTLSYCSILFLTVLPLETSGQEAPKIQQIKNSKTGKWTNIHQKRNDLLGIYVQQLPDNPYSAPDYEGKHPSMIIYVFKSMKAHQVEFKPDGTIKSGFWWNVSKSDSILQKIKNY